MTRRQRGAPSFRRLERAAHRPSAEPKLPPFFCVHPAGGDTGVYRQLATLLGEDLPFLGLDRFQDAPEVEERADRYVAMIRAVQPEGPYRLGGWSFGGVLAYEIARRIGGVELVALIDAGVPKRVENVTETTARRYADFGGTSPRRTESRSRWGSTSSPRSGRSKSSRWSWSGRSR